METQSSSLTRWKIEPCPFAIEYSPRVLDDIRLAVTDAFFSLPRGGAEIGGILLGHYTNGRVVIADAQQMPCEHAYGPSFTLSPRDKSSLAELIGSANRNPHSNVVGWYHSHTRTEIFLSDADVEIFNQFFPEPWQIAAVFKPHALQPTRLGFFFREAGASIRTASPYSEVVLEPLPVRPVPVSGAVPEPEPVLTRTFDAVSDGPVIDVSASIVEHETPLAAPPPDRQPADDRPAVVEAPAFVAPAPPPRRRWIVWVAAAVIGVALGAVGYSTRGRWLPKISAQASTPDMLALATTDRDGQLQISWNGNARAALAASGGSIVIVDGDQPVTVDLDPSHVRTGSFTYARKTGRVDVTLILPQPDGKELRETALFAGESPGAPSTPAPSASAPPPTAPTTPAPTSSDSPSPEVKQLQAEVARLRRDNAAQIERNKLLEKALDELRKVVQRDEQRRRLEVQSPDTAK